MTPLPEIFAGIGLIFIGVRTLAANLRQIAGPRLRRMMNAGIRSAPRASLIGLSRRSRNPTPPRCRARR
jgi:hypothetical protein